MCLQLLDIFICQAAERGKNDCVQALIWAGADKDAQTQSGATALMIVSMSFIYIYIYIYMHIYNIISSSIS